ncbi:Ger(x)C family spore germination protein [Paenibacillus sp. alder61]|uniref:Ger(x)C family spore germination protein n=1 Tax=Paenibacillus sp. alder61 TaxID=2862948 RepID=UPI001CD2BEC4|nr:Ger(x)C family spore germination protein [Paenibacillus sp. alder61]MCA1296497.1 Ger(x)C family spore germination protein [Paenibacillus sp. alder61]
MHKRTAGLFVLALTLLLTGCNQDQNILERIGYIRIGAFDPAEGQDIRLTINVPLTINEGQNTKRLTEVLTVEARGSKEARNMMQNQSSRKLVSGQLRTILFNMELAARGLTPYLDTLIRDPSISKRTEIVVAEGSAQEMISKKYPGHPGADQYIDQLLRKEFEMQHVPHILLHQFIRDYYDDGKDPMAPLLSPKDASLELSGIALFHYDKYAGKVERAEFPYFTMLYQNQNKGEFTINTDDPSLKSITFSAIKSKRKIKVKKIREGKYAADINIRIEGGVLEYIGNLDLTKPDRKKLEGLIGEYVTKRTERILAKLQRIGADPVGIGQYVRNKMTYSAWKESDWNDLYANMEFHVHTRFIIKNFGNRYD